MRKLYLVLNLFFIIFYSLVAQGIPEITLDVKKATLLPLSKIASEVIAIPISKKVQGILDVHVTNTDLFLATMNSIYHFTADGKFVNEILHDGLIGITGDDKKKILFVSGCDNKIKCYDYNGSVKAEYSFRNNNIACKFIDNKIWMLSHSEYLNSNHSFYLSYIDLLADKEYKMPYVFKDNTWVPSRAGFSYSENGIVFSVYVDSVIYGIEKHKINPLITWKVKTIALSDYDKGLLLRKGMIGKYIFIYIIRDHEERLYIGNMDNNKSYLVTGIVDDFYNSGIMPIRYVLNDNSFGVYTIRYDLEKEGKPYFYIVKLK